MTKLEFLAHLEKGLSPLNTQERSEILLEYAQHIDEKIKEGYSEKEAIDEFGEIDELLSELLSDPNYKKRSDNTERLKHNVSSFGEFIQRTIDGLLAMNQRAILSLIGRFFIYLIVFLVFQNTLIFVLDIIVKSIVPFGSDIFDLVLNFIGGIISLFLFGYLIYHDIKNRIFPYAPKGDYETMNYETVREENSAVLAPKKNITPPEEPKEDPLFKMALLVLKLFVVITFLLPTFFGFIGFLIATTFGLGMTFFGLPTLGLTMIGVGITLIHWVIIAFIWKLLHIYDEVEPKTKEGLSNEN